MCLFQSYPYLQYTIADGHMVSMLQVVDYQRLMAQPAGALCCKPLIVNDLCHLGVTVEDHRYLQSDDLNQR